MHQSPTRLLVIRHGETAWNRDTRIQGHTDIPLNDRGRQQAVLAARALTDEGICAVYSSDLSRAAETAQAIAHATDLPLTFSEGLRERHFGVLEGLTHDEIARQWPEASRRWRGRDPAFGPEGGETLQAFSDRVLAEAARLASSHRGETIVLVAHGGVLDCLYRAATGVGLEAPRTWQIANAAINRLMHSPQGFVMLNWADTRHLDAFNAGAAPLDEISESGRSA